MANGRSGKNNSSPRWALGWLIVLLVIGIVIFAIVITNLIFIVEIKDNQSPHCYRIFGTGQDETHEGEAAPFYPDFGGLVKGEIFVGDFCISWNLVYFNLTSPPTAMHIHGLVHENMTDWAPIFIDMGIKGAMGISGQLIHKDCLEISYEKEFAILARPESFFLNVHNEAFPNGAVRSPLGTRC